MWWCRIVWEWDLRPAPVCNRIAGMISDRTELPVVCLSAINPRLFDLVRAKREESAGRGRCVLRCFFAQLAVAARCRRGSQPPPPTHPPTPHPPPPHTPHTHTPHTPHTHAPHSNHNP